MSNLFCGLVSGSGYNPDFCRRDGKLAKLLFGAETDGAVGCNSDTGGAGQPDLAVADSASTPDDLGSSADRLILFDLATASDLAVFPDLAIPDDLSPTTDLALLPDLQLMPDLQPAPDLISPKDLVVTPDLISLPDLIQLSDISRPIDLLPKPDLYLPPDLATPLDQSVPADLTAKPDLTSHPDLFSPDMTVICNDGNPSISPQIAWLKNQIGKFGLVDSYPADGLDRAYLYDQALSIIAFSQAGEFCEAEQILKSLAAKQNANGSWQTCYSAQNGLSCEPYIHTGPTAWVVMAINFYQIKSGKKDFSALANSTLAWLDSMQDNNQNNETYGSLKFGAGYAQTIVSTEHNLDAYSAFYYRGLLDNDNARQNKAGLIRNYLLSEMWGLSNKSDGPFKVGIFWRGYKDFAWCTDPQSWGVAAFGAVGPNGEDLAAALEWLRSNGYGFGSTRNNKVYNGQAIDGYSFCTEDVNPPNGINPNFCGSLFVWLEGTEQVAAAYQSIGDAVNGQYFHDQTKKTLGQNGDIPYSVANGGVVWPCNYPLASVASTAWFFLAGEKLNPFKPF